MDANQQGKTESKLTATEDKLWLPPLSPKGQEKLIKQLRGRGYKVTEEYSDAGQRSKISREFPAGKTFWDWLQLLIIPLMLAIIGFWFTAQQNQTSQQLAIDQQRQTTLRNCVDDIKDLLLNKGLKVSKPEEEVRVVARAETLSTLRDLDGKRKGFLLQFLYESDLIGMRIREPNQQVGTEMAIISLERADLTDTELSYANLWGANLAFANLHNANLSYAGVTERPLSAQNPSIHFRFGIGSSGLVDADLHDADLSNANLYGSTLTQANLSSAGLNYADLRQAFLLQADLADADLRGADLREADLEGANLRDANVTKEQLAQAHSLKGAIMPDGTKHP